MNDSWEVTEHSVAMEEWKEARTLGPREMPIIRACGDGLADEIERLEAENAALRESATQEHARLEAEIEKLRAAAGDATKALSSLVGIHDGVEIAFVVDGVVHTSKMMRNRRAATDRRQNTKSEHREHCDMANVPESWKGDHHCNCFERRIGERRKVIDLMHVLKQSIMRGPDDDGPRRRTTERRQDDE